MQKTILNPAAAQALVPQLLETRNPNVWVYRYAHPNGWRLSIATHAEPGSQKLSLGGFRIAPEERTNAPGFDSDVEAIELAIGMEEKVYWSRVLKVGGPLARRDVSRIVGGKCVLHPTSDARVGQPNDRALLDFAAACLADCDAEAGIRITTGQDLGHGLMSDGKTQSLDYLHQGFAGSVVADTSKPTGEGNYWVLVGMLRAFGIAPRDSVIGLIGAGNIGQHLADRLRGDGATLHVLEAREERREQLTAQGAMAYALSESDHFFGVPMDGVAVNASGGTLSSATVAKLAGNDRLKVVCGSENLVLPEHADADEFRRAQKAFCPTELCGMMGYLTAAEQYLAHLERISFDIGSMIVAAHALERPAYRATRHMIAGRFQDSFERAVEITAAGEGLTAAGS